MITTEVDLHPYNTFGLNVKANKFARFDSIETLKSYLQDSLLKAEKKLVLGGGSNVLLTENFDGLVLKNELKGIHVIKEDNDFVWVKSASGEVWHDLVLHAIAQNWGGIENLSLIPGSVGAAPMQNIGAYGVELKDVFYALEALHTETLTVDTFTASDCQFGYRESVFKRALKGQYIITAVTLKLSKTHTLNTSYGAINAELEKQGITAPTIKDVSDAVIRIRQSKLPNPAEIGNAGSFFKNPVISREQFETLHQRFPDIAHYPVDESHIKLAAGWLIDQAGWKGKNLGNYGVHKNQALVLVNYGGADGKAIYELSEAILQSVKNIYGVELEREVNII